MILDTLLLVVLWYVIGIATILIHNGWKEGQLTYGDLVKSLLFGVIGPAIVVIIYGFDLFDKIWKSLKEGLKEHLTKRKDVVLWRSRRKKTEHILYGKDESDDPY